MDTLRAVVDKPSVFSRPTYGSYRTVNKSKTVGQRCPFAPATESAYSWSLSLLRRSIILFCDLSVMVAVDPLFKTVRDHADLWYCTSKSVDHIAQATRVREPFQDHTQSLYAVGSRSLVAAQTLGQSKSIGKSGNIRFSDSKLM